MDVFSSMISRKFRNIAGERYEEIMNFYREFLLSEEEMHVPEVSSILMPIDGSVHVIPEKVYRLLSAYEGVSILLLYVIDMNVLRIVEGTLGKMEAEIFKGKELKRADEFLRAVEVKLSGFRISLRTEVIIGHKGDDVVRRAREHDMIIVSKKYGSEGARSLRISPLVFRIVHSIAKPVVVY